MGSNVPTFRDTVLNVLREHGPMTRNDIAELLDWPIERVHSLISNNRYSHPNQFFRIVGYKRVDSGKGKDLSIYSAEGGIDKPRNARKDLRRKQAYTKYRKIHREIINSKSRLARATKQQKDLPINPWYQLAHSSVKPEMTQIMLRTKGQS